MGFMVVVFTMFTLPYACMCLCDTERDGVYGGRIHLFTLPYACKRLCDTERDGVYGGRIHDVHTSKCVHAFV